MLFDTTGRELAALSDPIRLTGRGPRGFAEGGGGCCLCSCCPQVDLTNRPPWTTVHDSVRHLPHGRVIMYRPSENGNARCLGGDFFSLSFLVFAFCFTCCFEACGSNCLKRIQNEDSLSLSTSVSPFILSQAHPSGFVFLSVVKDLVGGRGACEAEGVGHSSAFC